MDAHSRAQLDRILHPRSVAVVGASGTPGKFGWLYLKSLIHIGFSGNLYPINKNADEILGYKTYPSLAALPEVPDVVIFTIPARHVPEALEEALAAGIPGAVVITAGFSEDTDEGKLLEARVREIARRGIRVIGPNCFGVYSPKAGDHRPAGFGILPGIGPGRFFCPERGAHRRPGADRHRPRREVLGDGQLRQRRRRQRAGHAGLFRPRPEHVDHRRLSRGGIRRRPVPAASGRGHAKEAGNHLEGRHVGHRRPDGHEPHRVDGRPGRDMGGRLRADRRGEGTGAQ